MNQTDASIQYAMSLRARLLGLLPAALLFIAACALPALRFIEPSGADQTLWGIWVLASGWMGAMVGQFGWFANLLLP